MQFKIWLESTGPLIAYHQTSLEAAKKIMRYGFSTAKSINGIIWFTSDLNDIQNSGAQANGAILKLQIDLKKPAGWEEYGKLLLLQLKSAGYDGAYLPENDGSFTGFVFNPKQIKVLGLVSQ